jgi:hypothetical protein
MRRLWLFVLACFLAAKGNACMRAAELDITSVSLPTP